VATLPAVVATVLVEAAALVAASCGNGFVLSKRSTIKQHNLFDRLSSSLATFRFWARFEVDSSMLACDKHDTAWPLSSVLVLDLPCCVWHSCKQVRSNQGNDSATMQLGESRQ